MGVKELILADCHVHILQTVCTLLFGVSISRNVFSWFYLNNLLTVSLLFYLLKLFFGILYSVCSLPHLTFTLLCSALFPTLFGFCGNSQPLFSSLSDFYVIILSFLFDCSVSWHFLFPLLLVCYVIISCTCEQSLSLLNDHAYIQRENWKQDRNDLNQGLVLSFDDTC